MPSKLRLNIYKIRHELACFSIQHVAEKFNLPLVLIHQIRVNDVRFFDFSNGYDEHILEKGMFILTELGVEKYCAKCNEYYPCDSVFFYPRIDNKPHTYCIACIKQIAQFGATDTLPLFNPKGVLTVKDDHNNILLRIKAKAHYWTLELIDKLLHSYELTSRSVYIDEEKVIF
ncbi:hypothetical protein L0B53_18980 (plasmid) [Vibrio sp. SS-MA-C1-2]|uniref:hypothetical protein n=1 Tax=Vibrio sp. SS-MA-C1-2 TaxID=2908646 RepID=UPI001F28BA70|nr:hypothetical protein [Vibrio sp. SS-MA-C1-2]UJF20221.1 hypothetical protein L0B53_18980 [Vibrio sp. SS-MA-C1-2]